MIKSIAHDQPQKNFKYLWLEFYRGYLEDERRKAATPSEGGNFYASQNLRLGRRFAEAVVRATKEANSSIVKLTN